VKNAAEIIRIKKKTRKKIIINKKED